MRRPDTQRVVITGVGMVTPHGVGVGPAWQGVLDARSAVGPVRRFDASAFPVTFGAEAPDPGDVSDWLAGRGAPASLLPLAHDLKGRLAVWALREALEASGIRLRGRRLGVCLGSEAARPDLGGVAARLRSGDLPGADELARWSPDAPTRLVAALVDAEGPATTISTACTSSSQAVGEGLLRIRRGEVDAMVVGGVDVLVDPIMITGFSKLGALSTRNESPTQASRPFDRGRDGFVLGEGAGFLILERLSTAKERGAPVFAELSGFGCSCNAYRITDSPPDGRGAAQAMCAALDDARVPADSVGYVNAHGTSTPMNDASETRGIHRAFGAASAGVAVSSTKSMTGHLVAACGAVEAIFCALAVRDGVLPPTINLDDPDPECDLLHVAHSARAQPVRHALTNAFGFGGSNGSLLISRWDD
ncbi:MAG: beta-ketoacyl-[acyl-carrier-protein] synthase family protein [Myxococcota bacterium]|nr:beta-ketoacyl-[acyl-carrier-protein] synthase family protein [Myxococcota bacterium]